MKRLIVLLPVLILFGAGGYLLTRPEPPPEPPVSARAGSTSATPSPVDALPEPLRTAFSPDPAFPPLPAAGPGDWLANYPERGQTFAQFLASKPNRPDAQRGRIYLQPLGAFPKESSPDVETLRVWASRFFVMPTEVLPTLAIDELEVTTRANPLHGQRQLLTTDVLALLQRRLPPDAYCVLAITMEDLYPEPNWNFVFGQASLTARVGVFSFARYDPAFSGLPRDPDTPTLMLRRSCKVLAHEAGHMFGIHHCTAYHCVMNGSNSLWEADGQPIHPCPVDLRKLQWSTGFDVVERYRKLLEFYRMHGLDEEARWQEAMIKKLEG